MFDNLPHMKDANPEILAVDGPYRIAIHDGQRSSRPRPFDAQLGDDRYHLLAVYDGQVVWRSAGHRVTVNAPCAFLCPPGGAHHLRCPAACNWQQLAFDVVHVPLTRYHPGQFRQHLVAQPQPAPKEIWGCDVPVLVPADWLGSCLDTARACGALWWQDQRSWLLANVHLQSWITTYAIACMQSSPKSEDPWLQRVISVAEDLLSNRCTAAGLARALGLSRETLRRHLAARAGLSPGSLLEDLRMQRACMALTNDQRNLTWIAKWCGYGSVAALCHAFKRRFGTTPKRWRDGLQPPAHLQPTDPKGNAPGS